MKRYDATKVVVVVVHRIGNTIYKHTHDDDNDDDDLP